MPKCKKKNYIILNYGIFPYELSTTHLSRAPVVNIKEIRYVIEKSI